MISDPLALTALVAVLTLLAFWLDYRVPWLSKVGASMLTLALGALVSNLGLVPATSPVYDVISGPVTMVGIAWLLLSVHLGDLKRAGPRMLGAFGIALAGTVAGALVGALAFGSAIGEEAWKLSGTITGTYTGGSVNYVAVGNGLGLSPAMFVGATASDALLTSVWLGATLLIPVWLGHLYPPIPTELTTHPGGPADPDHHHHPFFQKVSLSTLDLAKLVALAIALYALAEIVAGGLAMLAERGSVPAWLGKVPSVLWLTTFALVAGHLRPIGRPEGAMQLGTLAIHFFFVVIGIWSRIADIIETGLAVFLYVSTVVLVHGLFVYAGGRLARIDVGTLSVASQAAVGGPSSALAVAAAREWPGLILPGVIVGLLGYAVGNYLGFGVAWAVQAMGIGL